MSAADDGTDYILGLDLGQAQDYTALAALERRRLPDPERPRGLLSHYAVRFLRRWQLKTPYTQVVTELKEFAAGLNRTLLAIDPHALPPRLAVDQTGVGRAVVDMIRAAEVGAQLQPVVITGGNEIAEAGGEVHVPKKELVGCLQVLLQGRRLKVAPVPDRGVLLKELLNFRVKVTLAANETFESWRERDHDDLVLAVAMAAWWGERNDVCVEYTAHAAASPRKRGGPHHFGHRMGGHW